MLYADVHKDDVVVVNDDPIASNLKNLADAAAAAAAAREKERSSLNCYTHLSTLN